jgi:hypothetical protein
MNTLVVVVVVVLFIFLLTYDPKTKTLEKYIEPPVQQVPQQSTEQVPTCPADRYYQVQFGKNAPMSSCAGTEKSFMGAVI